jgi:hypothetical protein
MTCLLVSHVTNSCLFLLLIVTDIHSEDLNVKATTTTDSSTSPARRTSELLDSLISPIAVNTLQDEQPHRRPSTSVNDLSDPAVTSHQEGHYDKDEANDSSHDPILHSIRTHHSLKKKSSDLTTPPQQPTAGEGTTASSNRFMKELNDRLATPLDVEQGLSNTTTTSDKESASSSNASVDDNNNNRWGWMKGAAASKVKNLIGTTSATDSSSVSFRSPLSRQGSVVPETTTTPKEEEEYNVVESSAILGEEDQAELDRIRLGAQGDSLTLVLNLVKRNPQFSFIAFTLFLASAMYFYSKHRGAQDDVN